MTTQPVHALSGDPASCRAAAAALRARAAAVASAMGPTRHGAATSDPPGSPAPDVPAGAVWAQAEALAAALDRFGAELRRAQHEHAAARRDLERNTALALAARARRRLRLACADTAPTGPLPWRP